MGRKYFKKRKEKKKHMNVYVTILAMWSCTKVKLAVTLKNAPR